MTDTENIFERIIPAKPIVPSMLYQKILIFAAALTSTVQCKMHVAWSGNLPCTGA